VTKLLLQKENNCKNVHISNKIIVEGRSSMDDKVLRNLSYGLFVLTANDDGKDNGCICNTAIQAAGGEIPIITVAVNKANLTCEMISKTKKLTVSILSEDASFDTFKHFGFQSGRDVDKFALFTDCKKVANGTMAITKGTNGYISAYVKEEIDLGTHMLFIAMMTDGEVFSSVPSATYAYYFEHIKPKPEAVGKTPDGQTVWRCKICGYEYVGEEIPEDFVCPLCKHPASDFEKVVK
jgi:flavin reductase (DIM6/NTAB) family NADH-FMN oxidoreductase RutF